MTAIALHIEFLVGLERSALKVVLDAPGELRAKPAKPAPRPLATPARRDVTLHLTEGAVSAHKKAAPLGRERLLTDTL